MSHHGTDVGIYASTSHVVPTGTGPPGQATLTLTIFFLGTTPPQTITVHGAHDPGSASGTGTVSAASAGHAGLVGNSFRRVGDIVTIE